MIDVIKFLILNVIETVWNGVQDVFSTASGALVAVVVAILLSIVPTALLIIAALVIFGGIVYNKYKETLDGESK